MAIPLRQNPIVVEVIDNLGDFLADVNVVQVLMDVVRAEIVDNVAVYVEVELQLAQARRRLLETVVDAAARLAPPGDLPEVSDLYADSEFTARAAAYSELADYVGDLARLRDVLVQALAFLVLIRAGAFAVARAPLVPGVLITAVAAYAVAYVASGGTVVPGSASLLRIFVIVLFFIFGVWD
ncbi:hypothetical protein QOZ80_1AG0029850 [Eleusine coracana subsp. coracana]|nr:hypothetical protein QOZ80_1AG0029850 [Eleusine coracana subsp. coracana]